ncbi:MAG: YbaB/EbfC family nucleoid-associated protein [Eggerthellaceae bacterium]|nr:YbaB/EbfC family nucleoid-associated protein [Eggerthellaceae bacterium]
MDMKQMMRQAQKMQAELAKAQEEIKDLSFEATAGGGMVKAVARGDMNIESISIDKDALDPEDVEMLEDMVCAAVNEALRGINDMSASRLNSVTGGMNIPGLM